MPTPSKASFGGSRKDQNAAHSRVYRLLKKQHTEELASEIAAWRGGGAAPRRLMASQLRRVEGPVVPQPAEPNAADDAAHVCDRAARSSRGKSRASGRESGWRAWRPRPSVPRVGRALRAKTAGDACISAAGAMIALAACVERSAEDARARSEAAAKDGAASRLPQEAAAPGWHHDLATSTSPARLHSEVRAAAQRERAHRLEQVRHLRRTRASASGAARSVSARAARRSSPTSARCAGGTAATSSATSRSAA